mgnify:CR=1 FL=1
MSVLIFKINYSDIYFSSFISLIVIFLRRTSKSLRILLQLTRKQRNRRIRRNNVPLKMLMELLRRIRISLQHHVNLMCGKIRFLNMSLNLIRSSLQQFHHRRHPHSSIIHAPRELRVQRRKPQSIIVIQK